jgi:hypothetical protein
MATNAEHTGFESNGIAAKHNPSIAAKPRVHDMKESKRRINQSINQSE